MLQVPKNWLICTATLACSDRTLRDATEKAIDGSKLDHVVCLALDPVYDPKGQRREDLSHMWVDNDYILDLQHSLGEKVLLGASAHPYDPNFKNRVKKYIDRGAVLRSIIVRPVTLR